MWRYLVGMLAGVLLVGGGLLWWSNVATAHHPLALALAGDRPAAPATATDGDDSMPEPPAASAKTREEKRFSRYDHDKNGAVSREEFLAARRKAFARLDTNHDGALSFDEYAVKTSDRFAAADANHDGTLNPTEFTATRIARKARARPKCAPGRPADSEES